MKKLAAKVPTTTLSYSVIKIAHLNDAFPESIELGTSPVEAQSLLQKDDKRSKRKGEKIIKNKWLYSQKKVFSIHDITCNLHVLNLSMVFM